MARRAAKRMTRGYEGSSERQSQTDKERQPEHLRVNVDLPRVAMTAEEHDDTDSLSRIPPSSYNNEASHGFSYAQPYNKSEIPGSSVPFCPNLKQVRDSSQYTYCHRSCR